MPQRRHPQDTTTTTITTTTVPAAITKTLSMRDLYNRPNKLQYWLGRIETDLEGSDREDVLKLVHDMEDKERAALWIVRCITALITMRKQLRKTFKDATEEDIRQLLRWMDANYKPASNGKFRQILKLFYKVVYGNGTEYPDKVKWFSSKLSKEKRSETASTDLAKYLEEDEVKRLVEAGSTVQRKAFLACLYESGARPEEFLRLTNRDIKIGTKGIAMILRGKTGERRVLVVSFAKLLIEWLSIHPHREQPEYALWISEATNYKNRPLGIRGAEKIVERTMNDAGLTGKYARPYTLRHSRATHLAKRITEAQLCVYMGWVIASPIARQYVHMSGKDLDATLIAISEGGTPKPEEYLLKTSKCMRCSETLSPGMNFCSKCGLLVSMSEQYLAEAQAEQKNKENERKLEELQNQYVRVQADLQMIMSVMPSLSQPARNELAKQLYQIGHYNMEPKPINNNT